MSKLWPEERLLLHCTRSHFDAHLADEVQGSANEVINWPHFIELSQRHGVLPLVYNSLSSLAPKAVPKAILAELRRQVQVGIGLSIYMTRELCHLLKLFKEHDIPTIPFKGPTLAVTAYGDLNLRPFGDLDLWVSSQNFSKAKNVLSSRGYRSSLHLDLPWECHFEDERGRVNIDLHQAVTPKEIPFPLEFEDVWKRLRTVPLANTGIPCPSPEDLLIILCVHLVKDCWNAHAKVADHQDHVRFVKICDIANLVRSQSLNWHQLLERAHALRSERKLLFGLLYAHALLGVQLPEAVLQKAQRNPLRRVFFAPLEAWLFRGVSRPLDNLEQIRFQLEVRERMWDRARLVLTPTQQDEKLLQFPPFFYFLYYLIRPIRLIGEFGLGQAKHPRRRHDPQ